MGDKGLDIPVRESRLGQFKTISYKLFFFVCALAKDRLGDNLWELVLFSHLYQYSGD